jgi:membrane-bound metal-dependent hydrolase YbcI (DUF457 family)
VVGMPFTLFHLGPALFLGLLLFEYINFPTFIVSGVIIDLEPFLVLALGLDYPMHGIFHSFLGGSAVAIVLFGVMCMLDRRIQHIAAFFKVEQRYSRRSILLASFLGIYLHIILDSSLGYADIKPLFPLNINPFYNPATSGFTLYICIISLVLGIVLYLRRVLQVPKLNDGE